ncbi:LysR substrate-binding domain-containing protein [Aquabacterium humicola]|uniref:LysR substrate-binding domain-containing protein n=1 Tax=Aquabacterium humicola TaxID=3237377 RepID=UPI002543F95F|nr:LysR substrate-binding domain-containing protein [Rubrivivax pictus]
MHRSELPRLDLLRTFEAAARHASFTRAADELALTQSAVSRQVQLLEEGLGVTLFTRRHRAIELTEAGRVMQRAVDDVMERLRDATARIRNAQRREPLSITCTAGFASLWLIPRLARFTAAHPAIDVRVSATHEMMDLERSGIDVAVRFIPVAQGQGKPLFEETLLPVCAPSLLRDRSRPLKVPADLENHTLLAVEAYVDESLMTDWAPWLVAMGLPELRMRNALRFSQYTDALAAAVAGQGVVIGRLPLLAPKIAAGELAAPFKAGAKSQRGYFVEVSRHAATVPEVQDLVAWLREEAARTGAEARQGTAA